MQSPLGLGCFFIDAGVRDKRYGACNGPSLFGQASGSDSLPAMSTAAIVVWFPKWKTTSLLVVMTSVLFPWALEPRVPLNWTLETLLGKFTSRTFALMSLRSCVESLHGAWQQTKCGLVHGMIASCVCSDVFRASLNACLGGREASEI